jgi:hypothetical protein
LLDKREVISSLLAIIKNVNVENKRSYKVIHKFILSSQTDFTLGSFLLVVLSDLLQPIFIPALENSFEKLVDIYSPVDALKLLLLPSSSSTNYIFSNVFFFFFFFFFYDT